MLSLTLALAAAALVAAAGMTPGIRRDIVASARRAEFWVAPALVLWPAMVVVLVALFGVGAAGDTVLPFVSAAPMLVIAIIRIVATARRRARWSIAGASIVGIAVIVTAVAAFTGQGWQHGVVATVSLAGVAIQHPQRSADAVSGIVAAVISAVALTALYGLVPGALRTDCGANTSKCELMGGFISVGGGSGSNALGITLAMLVGVVVFRVGGLRGLLAGVGVVAVILATGARLATAGAGLVVVVASAVAAFAWARRALPFIALGIAAVSTVPVFVGFPPHAFTERATLWQRAREMIAESPLVGHGLSFWVRDAATQPPPPRSYSPHNLWLDLLVAGGAVSVFLLVTAVIIGIRLTASSTLRATQLLLLCGIATAGIFEATVMPFRFGPIPAGFLLLVLLLASGESDVKRRRQLRPRSADGRRPFGREPASSLA